MNRRTFRVVAIMLAVFAVAASSCFTIRGTSLTNKVLGPGERTIVRVDMMPYNTSLAIDAKVFILVGWRSGDRVLPARFDTQGNWGGPYQGKNNLELRDALMQPGACTGYGVDASELSYFTDWEAWHTRVAIDATGPTASDFAARLRTIIRMERPAGAGSGGLLEMVIFSGAWQDDNDDNLYDAAEDFACTGVAFFSIPFLGA